jgi:hypothetical protein
MRSGKHSYIGTVEALRARCKVDRTNGCWHWQGCLSSDQIPRIHTFDHRRGEKRTMTGMQGAWNIAHGAAPLEGWLVMRSCGTRLCLNPVHLREVKDRKAIGEHIRRAGWRVGTALEARRANQLIAMAASGITPTPRDIVLAIRAAEPSMTATELAKQFGIARPTVSRIRAGLSHKDVAA